MPYFSAVTVPRAPAVLRGEGEAARPAAKTQLDASCAGSRDAHLRSQGLALARFIPLHAARTEPPSGSPVSSPAISIRSGCTPVRTRGARVTRPAATDKRGGSIEAPRSDAVPAGEADDLPLPASLVCTPRRGRSAPRRPPSRAPHSTVCRRAVPSASRVTESA